jgi:Icc-related predicted phosphoesterase
MTKRDRVVRIAAVGDVHCSKNDKGKLQPLFAQAAELADILVLAGDLTDYGYPEEAEIFVGELQSAPRIPTIAVLGNHDYEAGEVDRVREIICEGGVTLLDGDSCEVEGVGFAGVKGFAGGFGRGALGYWGEPAIKQFVQEVLDEALKLESALARLRTEQRVAVLHYAPIQATVEGEPPEIFPFLGCSRLEEPLTRYPVQVVLHGHAHNGAPEGQTMNGTPVYNVSHGLLQKTYPDQPPLRIIELPRG